MNNEHVKEDHTAIPTTVKLSPAVIRAAKLHSIKMGCRLKEVGSLNFFINKIVLDHLNGNGLNYRKLYPGYYK